MILPAAMPILLVLAGAQSAGGDERAYDAHALLARSETVEVRESSGIAPSHFDPDVFWTCNDSGEKPRVFALRLSPADRRRGVAADLGALDLRGARCVDWEDMAAGPRNALYVLDGGDNPPCKRTDKRIYRFVEPQVDWSRPPVRRIVPCETLRFDYPDPARPGSPARRNQDRYDAECLIVHPVSGDLYLVTKRDSADTPAARVYRLPAASARWNARSVNVLQFVADLAPHVAGMVTGGAAAADGRRVIVRNYLSAYEFMLPEGQSFEMVFRQKPRVISLLIEPQGEAICYARNGDLISTSEAAVAGPRFPIFVTPLATRPASTPAP